MSCKGVSTDKLADFHAILILCSSLYKEYGLSDVIALKKVIGHQFVLYLWKVTQLRSHF